MLSVIIKTTTTLFGEVTEQDGKVYVTYYTVFSKANNVWKAISLIWYALVAVAGIALTVFGADQRYYIALFALSLVLFVCQLIDTFKEKRILQRIRKY